MRANTIHAQTRWHGGVFFIFRQVLKAIKNVVHAHDRARRLYRLHRRPGEMSGGGGHYCLGQRGLARGHRTHQRRSPKLRRRQLGILADQGRIIQLQILRVVR